jgi:thiol-disulfide isomerase/thioredoxin
MSLFAHTRMPALDGATAWLNSEPLSPAALRGRVVLVDFWTLTCINWLRTEPHVRAWWQAYRDDGLVVIGVHTPEFSFEHDVELVRLADDRHAIDYPVAIDNGYEVWDAFANRYWPALYFVDRDGVIRDEQFGEGRYEHSEMLIQRLLGIQRELVSVTGEGVEAEADWPHLRTPETYLGGGRGERFDASGDAEALRVNHWALQGEWSRGPESVALERPGGSIAFRFEARDAHLVLAGGTGSPIPFRVLLDGAPPGAAHGVDTDADGRGELREGRLYQLLRVPDGVRQRTLRIVFDAPGAEAYAFTFG